MRSLLDVSQAACIGDVFLPVNIEYQIEIMQSFFSAFKKILFFYVRSVKNSKTDFPFEEGFD